MIQRYLENNRWDGILLDLDLLGVGLLHWLLAIHCLFASRRVVQSPYAIEQQPADNYHLLAAVMPLNPG